MGFIFILGLVIVGVIVLSIIGSIISLLFSALPAVLIIAAIFYFLGRRNRNRITVRTIN